MTLRHNFPVCTDAAYVGVMKTINSALGFGQSDVAPLRLRCILLLEKHGYEAVRTAYPSVSRASVYRWKKAFDTGDRKLSSLLPHSTRPHSVRQMIVPTQILRFLQTSREQYPRLSKYKLKVFLDVFCQEKGLPLYSVSWIGKVIRRNSLFFKTRRSVRRKHRTQNKKWVLRCPRSSDAAVGYLQVDGVKIYFEGQVYCFLTAVELVSREGFAKRVRKYSSTEAKVFLEEIWQKVGYKIHTVQTDNGSEFAGHFQEAIQSLQASHVWSRPRTPKSNGYVERFNWTIQDEFINYHIGEVCADEQLFDNLLSEWILFYNTKRPHQGLGYKTPAQYLSVLSMNGASSFLKCV